MPLILPGNVASATASTTYDVANSCRFNDGDSSYLHITPSAGDRDKFTFSCWVKRGVLGTTQGFFTVISAGNYSEMYFGSDNTILWDEYPGSMVGRIQTNRLFRDCSAWYHLVFVYDSANATAGNRMRLYVNGVEETSFSTDTQPDQYQDSYFNGNLKHMLGGHTSASEWVDGYMAEVCFIEGLALTPTSFGEFDEDSPTIWKPIDVSELTFGTNGFYLDFEDSANLGNDANGGTDLTEVNLDATNQATDTPMNNFATLNPLHQTGNYIISGSDLPTNGNTTFLGKTGSDYGGLFSSLAVANGKWYAEFKVTNEAEGDAMIGVSNGIYNATAPGVGTQDYTYFGYDGRIYTGGSNTAYGSAISLDDIVQIALDMDNNAMYVGINGTYQDSGDPTSGASKTGAHALAVSTTGVYHFLVGDYGGDGAPHINCNFGGCPPFAISSGNTDGTYGNFEYAPPSGYYALCTKNLAEYG